MPGLQFIHALYPHYFLSSRLLKIKWLKSSINFSLVNLTLLLVAVLLTLNCLYLVI